jgi:uroporphyrinogen-III decarboxylase
MNGYQRIISALKGEQPDAIPVMLHNFMMAAKEAGYTQTEYRSDPRKIKELLELFGNTPGFILNAGCAIPAETPPENLRTMIRIAREYS